MNNAKQKIIFVSIVILFLASRLFMLLFSLDSLYYARSDESLYEDTVYRGTIARQVVSGTALALPEYLDDNTMLYDGGTIISVSLNIIMFFLFGQTFLSLKLALLLLSLIMLVVQYLFLKEFFGLRAAVISSVLFIFCPPLYIQAFLSSWGIHAYPALFTLLAFCTFYRIFFSTRHNNSYWHFFFLGLICGIAIWAIYTSIILLVVILLSWFLLDKKLVIRKTFLMFSAAFFIGYLPGICGHVLRSINGENIIKDLSQYFSVIDHFSSIAAKAFNFISYEWPNSAFFNLSNITLKALYSSFYYCLFIVLSCMLLWRRKRRVAGAKFGLGMEFPLFLYVLFFSLFYILSDVFNVCVNNDFVSWRYLIPLQPFMIMIIALGINDMWKENKRIIPIILCAVVIVTNTLANISVLSFKINRDICSRPGYSYFSYGERFAEINRNKPVLKKINLLRFSTESDAGEFYRGFNIHRFSN